MTLDFTKIARGIYKDNLSAQKIIKDKLRSFKEHPTVAKGLELEEILDEPLDLKADDSIFDDLERN